MYKLYDTHSRSQQLFFVGLRDCKQLTLTNRVQFYHASTILLIHARRCDCVFVCVYVFMCVYVGVRACANFGG